MVEDYFERTDMKTLVIGCTPLARKVAILLNKISSLTGIVNLHPELGVEKSNYDIMSELNRKVDIFWTRDINDKETVDWIKNKSPDVIIQCGWSQIFKRSVLDIPKKYCLGIHPSPLPEGRGAAVLNWKIIESGGKDVEWGNSLFVMKDKTDTGDIIGFEPFTIEARDDIRTAYQKVDRTALKILEKEIPKIFHSKETLLKQDDSKSTRYYKRKPEEGFLNVLWNSVKIHDYVRALTHPYCGAFFRDNVNDKKIIVWDSQPILSNSSSTPGTVVSFSSDGFVLKCGENTDILIKRVEIDGVEYWGDEYVSEFSLDIGKNFKNGE